MPVPPRIEVTESETARVVRFLDRMVFDDDRQVTAAPAWLTGPRGPSGPADRRIAQPFIIQRAEPLQTVI